MTYKIKVLIQTDIIIKPDEKSGSGVKHFTNPLFIAPDDNDFHYHIIVFLYVQFFYILVTILV